MNIFVLLRGLLAVSLPGILFSCERSSKDSGSSTAGSQIGHVDDKMRADENSCDSSQGLKVESALPKVGDTECRCYVDVFAEEWDRAVSRPSGADILAKQREITLAAVAKLGGSEELLQLLDFLSSKGAGDLRQELIDRHLSTVFTGPRAEKAREWLLTVQDAKLREKLFRLAGEAFSGIGFKDYFEQSGAAGHNCQAALLTGYCVTLAKTDPAAAVRVYQEFGYPKRIDNTGMADVVAAFPPTADFLKFATETRADSFTLAKRTRAALLANWAGVKPEQAAQYVVSDTANVHPDQMGVVVRKWAETNPEGARGWLEKAPAVPARDDGWAALAEHWVAKGEIVKAWQNVGQVSDFDRKVKLATEVFKEWEKKDHDAAVKAWEELFPPGK